MSAAKRKNLLILFWVFLTALATMNPTWHCSTDTESEDDLGGEDHTPEGRCRHACDVLYSCGISVPDQETGVPISLPECRGGCEKDPGNIDCVDSCVEDYEAGGSCDDLSACASDVCAIPVSGP